MFVLQSKFAVNKVVMHFRCFRICKSVHRIEWILGKKNFCKIWCCSTFFTAFVNEEYSKLVCESEKKFDFQTLRLLNFTTTFTHKLTKQVYRLILFFSLFHLSWYADFPLVTVIETLAHSSALLSRILSERGWINIGSKYAEFKNSFKKW